MVDRSHCGNGTDLIVDILSHRSSGPRRRRELLLPGQRARPLRVWIKFCDDDRPLMRAEVPICVLGLAFRPGLAAVGDPRELRFNLTAAFAWGPARRLWYRPDNPGLPFFALTVRAGRGPLGSPARAPFALAAEFFNLLSSDPSTPAFFLRLKPRLRDFSLSNSNTLRSPADGTTPLAHAAASPECTAPHICPLA